MLVLPLFGKYFNPQISFKHMSGDRDFNLDEFESKVKNVSGTMALEGLKLNNESKQNLYRYAEGLINYRELIEEIKSKYQKSN